MYTKCFSIAQDLVRHILALRSTPFCSGSLPWPPPTMASSHGSPRWAGPCSPIHCEPADYLMLGGCHQRQCPGGSGVIDPGWAWEGGRQSGAALCKQIWPLSCTQGQPWLMLSKTSVMKGRLISAQTTQERAQGSTAQEKYP